MTAVTVRAPAKINLHLGVGATREDGFHPLDTVYQAVSLYDDVVAMRPRRTAPEGSIELNAADHIDLAPLDGGPNIINAAVEVLARHHERPLPASARLFKAIPLAGGMAGGSADAAAMLVGVDRLYDLKTSDADMLAIAAEIGSDVPFALVGGTARGVGRGELVTPVADGGSWWWVVVPSRTGLSTPEVYRHFDRLHPDAATTPRPADEVLAALATGEPLRLARALHNDLEEAAIDLRPELGTLIERGLAAGALRGLVSGSGPTVLFLVDDLDAANELTGELRSVEDVVLIAHGPVAGAHVVLPL